jgi:O-antigen/teichoic acid export membrane protein
MNDDNRRIAKNTIYLYSRMIVMMLVTLYTSRIILEKLGVDDYGIYQAVGGIVGFLSFINGVLSTGTSRFLTFELGTGNMEKLKRTFSTLLTSPNHYSSEDRKYYGCIQDTTKYHFKNGML